MSELLELLQSGQVEAFNEKRSVRVRPELFAAELAGKRLVGVDLSKANLEKADLTSSDLSNASLVDAELSDIDGEYLDLSGAIGFRARLCGGWCEHIQLTEADFTRANFTNAVLKGSQGAGVTLRGARLKGANLQGVVWTHADLSEASLFQADLSGADLSGSQLVEVRAAKTNCTGTNLRNVVGTSAIFAEAKLVGAQLAGAQLNGADFSGADLSNADCSGADFSHANLAGAILHNANFAGARLCDASLDEVDLSETTLDQADLSGLDPASLELTAEQLAGLAQVGARFDPDAALVIDQAAMACLGGVAAVVWSNPDSESARSLRFALLQSGESPRLGVIPIAAKGVIAQAVVAGSEGFQIIVLKERTSRVSALMMSLGLDGSLGPTQTVNLRYAPAVQPLFQWHKGQLWGYGVTRRALVVVQRFTDSEFELVYSQKVPTVRGFVTPYHPVLACKGGVFMNVGHRQLGPPVVMPPGFDSERGVVLCFQERLLALWFVPPLGTRKPGSIRMAELGGRGSTPSRSLARVHQVLSMDAIQAMDRVWCAYIAQEAANPNTSVFLIDAESEAVQQVALPPGSYRHVHLIKNSTNQLYLVIRTSGGGVLVVTPQGLPLGLVGAG